MKINIDIINISGANIEIINILKLFNAIDKTKKLKETKQAYFV